jgi:hypothetical protein
MQLQRDSRSFPRASPGAGDRRMQAGATRRFIVLICRRVRAWAPRR